MSASDAAHGGRRLLTLQPADAADGGRRLLTLHRPAAPPRDAVRLLRHVPAGADADAWVSELAEQPAALQLDGDALRCLLKALWIRVASPAARRTMLKDADFLRTAFKKFLAEMIELWQANRTPRADASTQTVKMANVAAPGASSGVKTAEAAGGPPAGRQTLPAEGSPSVRSSVRRSWMADEAAAASPAACDDPGMDSGPGDEPDNKKTARDDAATPGKRKKGVAVAVKNSASVLQRQPLVASEDICSQVPVYHIVGKKVTRDFSYRWRALADTAEDDGTLPAESVLFIRCVRCPHLVFRDYDSLSRHWLQKGHCLSCIMCDALISTDKLALAHLQLEHKEPVPEGWYRFVRCDPCHRSHFGSTEEVMGHMASHRSPRSLQPANYPAAITCFKKIRCNLCGEGLRNQRRDLEDHYWAHGGDPPGACDHPAERPPPLQCPCCQTMWAGAAALAAHLRNTDTECYKRCQSSLKTACPSCRRYMEPGEQLAEHMLTHLAPGIRCSQCGFVAGTHTEMRAHWTFLWGCSCPACDTHVGRGTRLLQHIVNDHDNGTLLNETRRWRPERNPVDPGICPYCGKHQRKLQHHINDFHRTRFCECCGDELVIREWLRHKYRMNHPDRVTCKVCAKTFSSRKGLRVHMRLHTGERPYECDECDAAYPQNNQLKLHKRTWHGE